MMQCGECNCIVLGSPGLLCVLTGEAGGESWSQWRGSVRSDRTLSLSPAGQHGLSSAAAQHSVVAKMLVVEQSYCDSVSYRDILCIQSLSLNTCQESFRNNILNI